MVTSTHHASIYEKPEGATDYCLPTVRLLVNYRASAAMELSAFTESNIGTPL
jgi:hypothetical protein